MATQFKLSIRQRARHTLGTLFREARRLERHRRLRYAVAGVLLCVAASGGGFLIASGNPASKRDDGQAGAAPARLTKLVLPKAGDYFTLGVVGGHVIVSGGPEGSLFPSGSTTSLSGDRVVGNCDAATVASAKTLKLTSFKRANCGDPALYGQTVLAISYLEARASANNRIGQFAVRIAHVDAASRDGYALGPVVMTYPQCSDCGAEWINGDGSLWLYDAYDGPLSRTHGKSLASTHGELLRVSDSSGKVLQRWAVPSESQELLAVDRDGLWFAPSLEGGVPLHATTTERVRYVSVYLVAPGARAPRRVLTIHNGFANWLVASDDTVWLASRSGNRSTLWRLQGRGAKATFLGTYPAHSNQGVDVGAIPATHAGDATTGIYYIDNPGDTSLTSDRQRIIRLSPDRATQKAVESLPAPLNDYQSAGVALGRSFYFLNPPLLSYPGGTKRPIVQGRGVLYRLTTSRSDR